MIAVGPNGSEYSLDLGNSWTSIGTEGFHSAAFAGPINAGWAVGEGGRIAKYVRAVFDLYPNRGVRPKLR
jgi:hypothetical protein